MALTTRRRRQAAAAAVVLLVLGLHALGLRAWAPAAVAPPAVASSVASAVAPLQVRALLETRPPAGLPPQAAPAPAVVRVAAREGGDEGDGAARRPPAAVPVARVAAAPQVAAVVETPVPLATAKVLPTAPDTPAEAPPAAPSSAPPAAEADDTLVARARPAAPSAPRPAGDPPPIHPTKLPPSFQWTFRMQRGILSGTGTLDWELDGARYRLALVGRVAGVSLLEWVSVGGIDGAGVAPERFVSQTRGRSAQATNFQRGAGKVTYSSSTAEHPLPAGVQDRVSWLVQIAAVVAASPGRYAVPGTPLALPVAGTRDVGLWQFVPLGLQTVETPAGRVEALALRREAKRAYDTRGEVWLDPQRHHLPVRVVLSTIDGNGRVSDSLVLALESTSP